MSRIFGSITQNGYVVRDIHAALKHWIEVLGKAGVPCGPINNVAQALENPQVEARNMLVENFRCSDWMRSFLKEEYDEIKALLTELGMAK